MTEQRRLAAIMFSDICGFSRIMGENEKRALAIVDAAVSVIEAVVGSMGGRIIKKMGDGALCEFSSAVNAVRAAVEIQRQIGERNRKVDASAQFQLRIGIHVGDVVVAGTDIMGDGVNVASRIEPLAEPGGVCISRDVFDLVQNKLSIETINLGPQDLKNISRRIDIYRVLIDAVDTSRSRTSSFSTPEGRKRLKYILTMVGLGVLLVAAGGFLAGGALHRAAKKKYVEVTTEARALAEAGKLAEAMDKLRSYPKEFKYTPWQAKVDEHIDRLHNGMAREEIIARQKKFFQAIVDNERSTTMQLIDPEILRRVDGSTLWGRLRLMAGILKIGSVGPEDFRIEAVVFDEKQKSAQVLMQVFRKTAERPEGVWEKIPPSEWRQIDNQWYLHIEKGIPPEPTDRPPPPRAGGRWFQR